MRYANDLFLGHENKYMKGELSWSCQSHPSLQILYGITMSTVTEPEKFFAPDPEIIQAW